MPARFICKRATITTMSMGSIALAVKRASGAGYDEAAFVFRELREGADQRTESRAFHVRCGAWVHPHLRRPVFVNHLHALKCTIPCQRPDVECAVQPFRLLPERLHE